MELTAAAPILVLSKVTKRFEESDTAQPVEVLRGVTLEIPSGQSLAIVGPSGSGKSTLLNIMGTLDRPTSGEILLDGKSLIGLKNGELAAVRNRKIGFVFQSHHLLPQCSVMENVLLPTLAGQNVSREGEDEERARLLLKRVGLGARLTHRPGQLSGGERQRVAVVRALINRPRLLLADEPTGSLDRSSAQDLSRLLVELNREEGVTLITVTHALELAGQMGVQYELRDGLLHPHRNSTSEGQA
jgi:ABC-type lipoprotein export system ATPase subunit